jgi:hypothetical protein
VGEGAVMDNSGCKCAYDAYGKKIPCAHCRIKNVIAVNSGSREPGNWSTEISAPVGTTRVRT